MQSAYHSAGGGARAIYGFLLEAVRTQFDAVSVLRETERGSVALLRHHGSGTAYIFRRFQGEPDVCLRLRSVSSPHLPRIYEVASSGGETLVLEEYVRGDTLYELLKGAAFTPKETKEVALDLCRALWVLHGSGAVHRDVKPENVILRPGGAVLIDFDASRVVKPLADSDTRVLGTLGYAAPEQFGFSQTDARADIYSLGVLMNVMLTGKHPSREHARGRLGRVVRRCTMTDPEKRYPDVLHLMEALS